MAVSWYSPSAVLTPGGVTAGLSDLAGVIASAPERRARIEQQMAAESRANREAAINEIRAGGGYTGQDAGLASIAQRIQQDRDYVVADQQRRKQEADLRMQGDQLALASQRRTAELAPVDRARTTGIPEQGTFPRADVAQAAGMFAVQEQERKAKIAREQQRSDEEAMQNRASRYEAGAYNPLMTPIDEMGMAQQLSMQGWQKRDVEKRKQEAYIKSLENRTPSMTLDDKIKLEGAKSQFDREESEISAANKELRDMKEALMSRQKMFKAQYPTGKPSDEIFSLESWNGPNKRQLEYQGAASDLETLSQSIKDREAELAAMRIRGAGVTGPQQNGMQVRTERTAVNDKGEKLVLRNGAWVPL
jgi:hypothetical protein